MQNRSAVETEAVGCRLQDGGNYRTDLTDQTDRRDLIGLIGLIGLIPDLTPVTRNL